MKWKIRLESQKNYRGIQRLNCPITASWNRLLFPVKCYEPQSSVTEIYELHTQIKLSIAIKEKRCKFAAD